MPNSSLYGKKTISEFKVDIRLSLIVRITLFEINCFMVIKMHYISPGDYLINMFTSEP